MSAVAEEVAPAITYHQLRNALRVFSVEKEEWAGIPMPVSEAKLIIEPRYPHAAALMSMGMAEPTEGKEPCKYKVRSTFWSQWRKSTVIVVEDERGRVFYTIDGGVRHFDLDIQTLGNSVAWGVLQEFKAMELLAELIEPHAFDHYVLTGMFLETSPRSNVTYCFRRLRPTVALCEDKGRMRILCAMCMHPIGYYARSYAGAMCPTDDVIAHLMLMRGDEAMFWRRCNQHPAYRPEAGL